MSNHSRNQIQKTSQFGTRQHPRSRSQRQRSIENDNMIQKMIDEKRSLRQSQSSQMSQHKALSSRAIENSPGHQQETVAVQPQFTLTGDTLV